MIPDWRPLAAEEIAAAHGPRALLAASRQPHGTFYNKLRGMQVAARYEAQKSRTPSPPAVSVAVHPVPRAIVGDPG
jgi:hypothetical protein